jgi:Skp family chaperone for outer membrane proteins
MGKRGPMKFRIIAAGAAVLAASLVVSHAQSSSTAAAKHAAVKKATPAGPTVQEQIDALRREMQGQIDSLKSNLADKDAQLRQAQQAAADAQATAAKAEADAQAQQAAFNENTAAVTSLQSSVKDLTNNQASLTSTLSDETTNVKKMVNNPDAVHFKGVTLSPTGSFLAAETVNRSTATAGDINTPFTGIPLANSQAAQLSEFFGSGRQSRIALKATGKLSSVTLTGYYEADFLSAGVTSNDNQSNSYTLRQRQLWADAKLNDGWDFSGGQGWSLATETTQGLTRGTEILPATIDAQYETGFVWARQYSFRVTKDIGKAVFFGVSAENPETLSPGGSSLPTNILVATLGTSAGLYNAFNGNYSFNYLPDFVVKMAFEPGWGHWEIFNIDRVFRDRIYPAVTTSVGAYNDKELGAGIGGGFRGPLFNKALTIGLKGLWGQGMGRYGSSTIDDVTVRPDGQLSPIHGFSALSTVEVNPNPRATLYFNYGGDLLDRDYVLNGTSQVGYGARNVNMSGCALSTSEPPSTASTGNAISIAPSNCSGNTKDVQEFTAGYWFNIIAGPQGRLRQGIQYSWIRRDLWSGAGGTNNPSNGAKGEDNMIFTSFRYYLP